MIEVLENQNNEGLVKSIKMTPQKYPFKTRNLKSLGKSSSIKSLVLPESNSRVGSTLVNRVDRHKPLKVGNAYDFRI